MDQIEDASHDLTKVDIPVMGANVIDSPSSSSLPRALLVWLAHPVLPSTPKYAVHPDILSIYEGEDLFWDFERFEEGK